MTPTTPPPAMGAEAKMREAFEAWVRNELGDDPKYWQHATEWAAWQEATRQAMEQKERAERNRDMWKAQCEEQARRLEALHIAIAEHNADCIGQCEARKKIGKTSCYMLGYDRECGDCPRDGMVNLPTSPTSEESGNG